MRLSFLFTIFLWISTLILGVVIGARLNYDPLIVFMGIIVCNLLVDKLIDILEKKQLSNRVIMIASYIVKPKKQDWQAKLSSVGLSAIALYSANSLVISYVEAFTYQHYVLVGIIGSMVIFYRHISSTKHDPTIHELILLKDRLLMGSHEIFVEHIKEVVIEDDIITVHHGRRDEKVFEVSEYEQHKGLYDLFDVLKREVETYQKNRQLAEAAPVS